MQGSGGYEHTVILSKFGTVWTCGTNATNQLGYPCNTHNETLKEIKGFDNICKVYCSHYTTLLLDTNGKIWLFGRNIKTHSEHIKPLLLDNLPFIIEIACCSNFICCVDDNNNLWFYGEDIFTREFNSTFITKDVNVNVKVKKVECGYNHCLCLDNNGNIFTIGKSNSHGQLGVRDTNETGISRIEGIPEIIEISCGYHHNGCRDINGELWFFGYNSQGQLGVGNFENQYKPIKIEGFSNCLQVYCGEFHSCLISENEELYFFGSNNFGQLGIGVNNNYFNTPFLVGLEDCYPLVMGGHHNYFINRITKEIFVFGRNNCGQLSMSSTMESQPTPYKLSQDISKQLGLSSFRQKSARK